MSSWPSRSAWSTSPSTTGNPRAQVLADTLDRATGTFLNENKSPARQVGRIDNRGSHFYLALYWAQELAEQTDDPELAGRLRPTGRGARPTSEQVINDELLAVQGSPVDLGGYYRPDPAKATAVMTPSATFNAALARRLSEPSVSQRLNSVLTQIGRCRSTTASTRDHGCWAAAYACSLGHQSVRHRSRNAG